MKKLTVLEYLYQQSPMDFYTKNKKKTVIRSTNNASFLGYKFSREFSEQEIDEVWQIIRIYKRFSVVFIFILFVALLYEFIFPRFALFINNSWYVNAFIMFGILVIVSQFITTISTFLFEKKLLEKYGKYDKVYFEHSKHVDKKYYSLFISELTKAGIAFVLIFISATFFSPFEYAQNLIDKHRYKDVIKVTSLGAKLLPVAPEWYSLRGYANFQLEQYDHAIKDYDKAYKLSAEGFNIMNFDNKIFVKYYQGNYEEALADFDIEIQNANNENEKDQFLWDKAQFLYNIKKYKEALIVYNELIEKAENDRIFLLKDRLYLERAEVHRKLKNYKEAKLDAEAAGLSDFKLFKNPIPKPVLMLDEETFYSF
jgi:tetratricopeptide (TPR) repeat protein